MKFKQAIHIEGKCIEDIFNLPCVKSIQKDEDSYYYYLYNGQSASLGDWLCESEDSNWYVLSPEQYRDYWHDLSR